MISAARFLTIALAATFLAAAAPRAEVFSPWVTADVEFGERSFRADTTQILMNARLSLAKAVVLTEDVRLGRSEPLLNAFYHVVPAQTLLYVLSREDSDEVVACTTTATHVAANIFTSGGRIDSPTCLVDTEPDGRFNAVTWGAWTPGTHALQVQNVVAHDPPVLIDLPYELVDAPAELAAMQFIDIQFAVSSERGAIEMSVRGPDGALLRRERRSLRRVREPQTIEFFGCEIEIARTAEGEFSWRPLRTPTELRPFRLSWRGD